MRASTFVLIGSVVGLLLSASVLMAQVPPPAKGYVGTQACRECHDSYYRSYMQTSHGIKEDKRTPEAKFGCETCHGGGDQLVTDGRSPRLYSMTNHRVTASWKANDLEKDSVFRT